MILFSIYYLLFTIFYLTSNRSSYPVNIYLFKVTNRNTRKKCEIYSKLTIKTPERRQLPCFSVSIVNFEHVITGWYIYILAIFVTLPCFSRLFLKLTYASCMFSILKDLDFLLQAKQFEVLSYRSTWFSLWLWTINSADAFMNYTLIAVFSGKLWVCKIVR